MSTQTYQHLSQQERYAIAYYHESGFSPRAIAEELGRNKSTITRELQRNRSVSRSSSTAYDAEEAQAMARDRQRKRSEHRRAFTPEVLKELRRRLGWGHSPDIISGRCRREGKKMPCCESIYQYLYADAAAGGELYRYLLRKRRRRKPHSRGSKARGQLRNRVMIDQRPEEVTRRSSIGHWEGDTIVGKAGRSAVVSLLERRSRFLCVEKLPDRSAKSTATTIIQMLGKQRVDTLTVDNGKEFAEHQRIALKLKGSVYFCDAYSPWQRGSNEQGNGMLRRYFRKGTDFSNVRRAELKRIVHLVNNRPRKILGYATAWEVFSGRAEIPSETGAL